MLGDHASKLNTVREGQSKASSCCRISVQGVGSLQHDCHEYSRAGSGGAPRTIVTTAVDQAGRMHE